MLRLIGLIALFVLLGAPMVAYLWETINVLLTGRVEPRRLGIALVVLAVFAGLLATLSRAINAMEGGHDPRSGPNLPGDDVVHQTPTRRSS